MSSTIDDRPDTCLASNNQKSDEGVIISSSQECTHRNARTGMHARNAALLRLMLCLVVVGIVKFVVGLFIIINRNVEVSEECYKHGNVPHV